MAIYMGQWQVPPGTSNTFTLPPGVFDATIYNNSSTAIYLAVGTSPTTPPPNVGTPPTTWLQLHSVPTSFNGYQGSGSGGGHVWAISTASTATVPVNYIISTQQG
jgi:hypothetical protein